MIRYFLPVFVALGFTASAIAAPLPDGVWLSPGFGAAYVAGKGHVQVLETSSAGCLRGARHKADFFTGHYGEAIDITAAGATLDRGPAREFLTRVNALPSACKKPVSGKDPLRNAQILAATFADHYPFFAARGVDWGAQSKALLGPGAGDLFDRLVAAVAPLKDDHVTLAAGKRSFDSEGVFAPGVAADGAAWTWASLRRSLRDRVMAADGPLAKPTQFAGNRRMLYGRTIDGFGYIAILA